MSSEAIPRHPEIYRLRPWYHDFSSLGLETIFPIERPTLRMRLANVARRLLGRPARPHVIARSSHFVANQQCKEGIIRNHLQSALATVGETPRSLELFCADGYYACLLQQQCLGAAVTGVDLNGDDIERATAAASALGLDDIEFVTGDAIRYLDDNGPWDLILCLGGLYHLSNPAQLIEAIARRGPKRALFQSVVTLENEDADFFVAPAPGWQHGCRFSHQRLQRWLTDSGLRVLAEDRNILTGNRRAADRGSSYFLCTADP
ncbi:MAG: methyltransferase domain-containing protein [Acidobacteriota bacterium]